ncbi:MAG: hypothetical protein AAB336_03310, partial [Acidobacteriota bacterium]
VFSMARSSIQEWHNEEFLPLESPVIEIPYPAKVENSSRSWLVAIRDFFTLSPAWMTASTAFAALAICIGLFAVVVSSLRDNMDVADKGNVKIISSPTHGNQNQNSNVSNANQNKQKPVNLPEPPISEKVQKPTPEVIEPTKIVAKPNSVKTQTLPVKTVQPKTNNRVPKQPLKTQKQKVPSFLDEDEEEDSLTLTDLLEEIGAREIDD